MEISLRHLFDSGGVFMWPILILSILAVTLIIERALSLVLFSRRCREFVLYLTTCGKGGSSGTPTITTSVFALSPSRLEAVVGEQMQLRFDKQLSVVEMLAGIGGVAPLLGFIGTVSGMIASSQNIANADRVSVKLVAGGISEALITTGFGLIVAVVCFLAEHLFRFYLSGRAHRLTEAISVCLGPITQEGGGQR